MCLALPALSSESYGSVRPSNGLDGLYHDRFPRLAAHAAIVFCPRLLAFYSKHSFAMSFHA